MSNFQSNFTGMRWKFLNTCCHQIIVTFVSWNFVFIQLCLCFSKWVGKRVKFQVFSRERENLAANTLDFKKLGLRVPQISPQMLQHRPHESPWFGNISQEISILARIWRTNKEERKQVLASQGLLRSSLLAQLRGLQNVNWLETCKIRRQSTGIARFRNPASLPQNPFILSYSRCAALC